MKRILGKSGIEVSAMGMGCWAIGGPWDFLGTPGGWGSIDDRESLRALDAAFALGVTFFDTAANYGAGHSETILGQALKGRREKAVIATKFGYQVNEKDKSVGTYGPDEESSDVASRLNADLDASLRRLGTDYIDLFQLHVGGLSLDRALEAREVLEKLVAKGKIRAYGWSTDRADAQKVFCQGEHCAAAQQQLSILDGNRELLEFCERHNIASLNRSPLAMGLLTGKFSPDSRFADNDVRKRAAWHPAFKDGKPTPKWLNALDSIRHILTSEGRTLAQGALAGIWARSPATIPIPGFKTVEQVEENCRAMEYGPLTAEQWSRIDALLEGFAR